MKTIYKEKHLSSDEMIRLVKKSVVNGESDHAHQHLKECDLCREAYEGLKTLPDMSALQLLNSKWKLKSGIKPSPKKLEINLPALYTMLTLIGLISVAIIYFFFFNPEKNKTQPKANAIETNPSHMVKPAEHFMIIQNKTENKAAADPNNIELGNVQEKGVYDEIKKPREPIEKLEIITATKEIPQATLELIKGNTTDQLLNIEDFKIIDYSNVYIKNENMLQSFSEGLSARYETENNFNEAQSEEKSNTSIVSYEEVIAKALRNYKKGKFNEAVSDFNFILKYFPGDLNAQFYKALCYKDNGEYIKAIDVLKPLTQSNTHTFYQEAKWHLALCYQSNHQDASYKKLLLEIINEGGFYKQHAEKAME